MKRLLVTLTVFAGVLAVAASPAAASCAEIPPVKKAIADADILFVGTVVETTNDDRWATVEVEEVWKGGDIADVVEVRAGPPDPPGPISVAGSNDRTYRAGVRYLFFPYGAKGDILQDSACSRTTRLTRAVERFRPASMERPTPAPEPTPASPGQSESLSLLLPVGVAVVVVALGGFVFARRRGAE